jgi:uncharacterized protein
MSRELLDRAREILQTLEMPERHSYFQIEKFMIGKEPTGYAQLWQVVREIKVRIENIDGMELQLEETSDNVEELEIELLKLNTTVAELERSKMNYNHPETVELDIRLQQVQVRRLERRKKSAEQSLEKLRTKLKYTMEEVACLINAYEKILAKMGDVKPLDDPQAQAEMWNEKFLEEFNLRVLLKNPLDTDLVRSIMALDDSAPVKKHVVALIQMMQKQMIAERERQLRLMNEQTLKPQ